MGPGTGHRLRRSGIPEVRCTFSSHARDSRSKVALPQPVLRDPGARWPCSRWAGAPDFHMREPDGDLNTGGRTERVHPIGPLPGEVRKITPEVAVGRSLRIDRTE